MVKKLLIALTSMLFSGMALAIEVQQYTLDAKADGYEIRSYPAMIVVQTKITADFEVAGGMGFRILADYIFGDNISPSPHQAASPILQNTNGKGIPKSEKIAMITPVNMVKTQGGFWVQFIMPAKYSLETLPHPEDGRVKIAQIPARKVAVIQYSGTWTYENYTKHLNMLLASLQRDGIRSIGEPIFARYNAPFQLWFLRHNEIWVEVY